jgi:hypothetical protein
MIVNWIRQNKLFLSNYSHILNPLNAELNSICHLLALLRAHLIFHVSRIRVKNISIITHKNGKYTNS